MIRYATRRVPQAVTVLVQRLSNKLVVAVPLQLMLDSAVNAETQGWKGQSESGLGGTENTSHLRGIHALHAVAEGEASGGVPQAVTHLVDVLSQLFVDRVPLQFVLGRPVQAAKQRVGGGVPRVTSMKWATKSSHVITACVKTVASLPSTHVLKISILRRQILSLVKLSCARENFNTEYVLCKQFSETAVFLPRVKLLMQTRVWFHAMLAQKQCSWKTMLQKYTIQMYTLRTNY